MMLLMVRLMNSAAIYITEKGIMLLIVMMYDMVSMLLMILVMLRPNRCGYDERREAGNADGEVNDNSDVGRR